MSNQKHINVRFRRDSGLKLDTFSFDPKPYRQDPPTLLSDSAFIYFFVTKY